MNCRAYRKKLMKIKYIEDFCNGCGDKKLIVQKTLKLCIGCNQKRLTKRYQESRKKKISNHEKADKTKLQSFYREVWDSHQPTCYETGQPLWNYRSWHVHHVLHKEDYPNLAFNHDVCVLLTLEMHSLWHTIAPSDRPRLLPKTYQKYLDLCKQYEVQAEF